MTVKGYFLDVNTFVCRSEEPVCNLLNWYVISSLVLNRVCHEYCCVFMLWCCVVIWHNFFSVQCACSGLEFRRESTLAKTPANESTRVQLDSRKLSDVSQKLNTGLRLWLFNSCKFYMPVRTATAMVVIYSQPWGIVYALCLSIFLYKLHPCFCKLFWSTFIHKNWRMLTTW